MRVGIVADTHGNRQAMIEALDKMAPLDRVVHLGDFTDDLLEIKHKIAAPYHLIAGNNDYYHGERESVFDWEGVAVFAAHGDRYDVDAGLDRILKRAAEFNAKLVLFGHTHRPIITQEGGVWVVNPGTLWLSEKVKSTAVVEINRGIVTSQIIFEK